LSGLKITVEAVEYGQAFGYCRVGLIFRLRLLENWGGKV